MRTSKTVTTKTYAIAKHTVTFVADGVTVKTMTVNDGYVLKASDYPTVPAKAGYIGSWNKYNGSITSDRTIPASYRLPKRCVVTFKVENTILKTMVVDEGYVLKSTDYPMIPHKPNYHGFWSFRNSPITADTTVTGAYIPDDVPDITIPPTPTTPPDIQIASAGDEEDVEESQAATEDTVSATAANSPAMELVSTVTERHDYIYAGGKLLRETITTTATNGTVSTQILDFTYDATGSPYSLTYTSGTSTTVFYYITNLQGDVIYLINNSGTKVATYEYDPYGKITDIAGTMAQVNPLRYRGYYYDNESGFYYLQSRYYDPSIGRFINADGYASTGQSFLGYNMFAYCNNSPANGSDPSGRAARGNLIVTVCDGGSSSYIYDQESEPYASMPFGGSTISHGGCGSVSVYNTAQILGRRDISFDDVLEYYENSGGILLGGLLGSLPHTAENYFKDQGYDVVTLKGDAVFYAGNMSKEFDASILWFWFKDDEFPYFGANFIAFKQFEDAGYYYNFTDSVYRSTGSFYYFVDTRDILYAEMILIKKP